MLKLLPTPPPSPPSPPGSSQLLSNTIISKLLLPLLFNSLIVSNYYYLFVTKQWLVVVEATDLATIEWTDPVVDIKAGRVKYKGDGSKVDMLFNKLMKPKRIEKTLIAGDRMQSSHYVIPKLEQKWASEYSGDEYKRTWAMLQGEHELFANTETDSKIQTVRLANGRHVSVGFAGPAENRARFAKAIEGKTFRDHEEVNALMARTNVLEVRDGGKRKFLAADANGAFHIYPDIKPLEDHINTNGFLKETFKQDLINRFGGHGKRIEMGEGKMLEEVTEAYEQQSQINGAGTTPTSASWNGYIHERPDYGRVGNFMRQRILGRKEPAPRFVSRPNVDEERLVKREKNGIVVRSIEDVVKGLIRRGAVADFDEFCRYFLPDEETSGSSKSRISGKGLSSSSVYKSPSSISGGEGMRSGRHPPPTPSRRNPITTTTNSNSNGAFGRMRTRMMRGIGGG